MNTLSKSEVSGLTVRIVQDEDPQSPREWTHGAELVYSHGRYDFPNDAEVDFDQFGGWGEVAAKLTADGALLVVPVYMIDHSGLAFRVGADFGDIDPGNWDSGQIGLAYVTPQNWADTQGTEWTGSDEQMATARALAVSDVETYGQYVSGEVYGYVISDGDTSVESLWGIYDYAEAEAEAAEAAKSAATAMSWPAGKTFGELTDEQKRHAARRAAERLTAELEANADAITTILGMDA